MRYLKIRTFVLATPVVLLGFFLIASCATGQKISPPAANSDTMLAAPLDPGELTPGPNDPRIAYVTARLLEQLHYTQRPMDSQLSAKFFDEYVDSLDSRHENFLQSDLDAFAIYRTNLDTLTTGSGTTANLTPAFAIYERFLERLRQHDAYVLELLKQNHFKFNTDERIAVDRRHEPYPKDLDEAHKLWEQRLKFEYLQEKLSKELTNVNDTIVVNLPKNAGTNITDYLIHHYQSNMRTYTNYDSTDVLQLYLNGLTHAYDPHSDYFNLEHANDFAIQMNLSLFGIGAQLVEDPDGFCTINKLIVGGPAEKSKKLNEKDRIVAVAQGTNAPVNVVDMELGKVVELIRGPKATEVRLTISPESDRAARKIVTLVRDEIKLDDQAAKARLIEMPDAKGGTTRLGVIDLPSFYAPVGGLSSSDSGEATPKYTSVDVSNLVVKLKQENVNGIILDIRTDPGGSLEEAVKFTGLFIKDGPVVQARSPDGPINVDSTASSSILYTGPLAVMVNRYSASASEIAAAALQDYDRALIVGDSSSFGKGTVQSLNPLRPFVWPATPAATNDPGVVKITIRKFYRISGGSTQFKGVVPDIILPDPLDYQSDIESESTLDYPLPWDTIPSAPYTKFGMVQQYVPALAKKSSARVATNQEFTYIRQDIAEMQKMQEGKSITLNEHEAIKERQDNQARQKARDAERDARKPDNVKVYEISLADAAKPGLPAPSYYPGMMETNVISSTTINFKPTDTGSGTSNSLKAHANSDSTMTDNKTIANCLGLDLATGTLTNNSIPVANLTDTERELLQSHGVDKSAFTGTNLTIINDLSFTNSTLSFDVGTVKPKNQADIDPLLQETDQIMMDYISLLSQNGGLTKN